MLISLVVQGKNVLLEFRLCIMCDIRRVKFSRIFFLLLMTINTTFVRGQESAKKKDKNLLLIS
jgi:hypothetical protein